MLFENLRNSPPRYVSRATKKNLFSPTHVNCCYLKTQFVESSNQLIDNWVNLAIKFFASDFFL